MSRPDGSGAWTSGSRSGAKGSRWRQLGVILGHAIPIGAVAAAGSGSRASSRAISEPDVATASPGLRLVRRIGLAVLGLQLVGFMTWSTVLYQHFALTWDFSIYHQAWVLVAHGHLNPFDTSQGIPFWRNHGELLMWPLAAFYWVWPHGVTLLYLQDLAVVGAEAVAFVWINELAASQPSRRLDVLLAATGLLALVMNPWIWWSVSFDFHLETFAIAFAVLAAYDLAHGRPRRAWAFVVLLVLAGVVSDTYVVGIGLGALIALSGRRRQGLLITGFGTAAIVGVTLLHGNQGAGIATDYGYLSTARAGASHLSPAALAIGIAHHPGRIISTLWSQRLNAWANLAPAGLFGIASPLLLPLVAIVMVANLLFPHGVFAAPSFQWLPVYLAIAIGTVSVLARVARWRRFLAAVLAIAAAASVLGWASVFGPRVVPHWLRVSTPASRTLASLEARIPLSAEVIASQGVAGRFAGRALIYPVLTPTLEPVRSRTVWFVVAPRQGSEVEAVASADALIADLAGPLHARLVVHANGIFAFVWHPLARVRSVAIPAAPPLLPSFVSPGAAGSAVLTGQGETWHVTANGRRGYVVDGLVWRKPSGTYRVLVTLASSGPVNVEVWNDTGAVLLARNSVPATDGFETVVLSVNARHEYPKRVFSGIWPFSANFVPPPPGNRLEVRVWSPGAENVEVDSAEILPAPPPHAG